jgi:hypothetical protein
MPRLKKVRVGLGDVMEEEGLGRGFWARGNGKEA